MAEPLVSPTPGGAPPPCRPPRAAMAPAATSLAVKATNPTPATPGSPSPLSPLVEPFHPTGRSKTLCWSDTSPSPTHSGDSVSGGARSFRDIVAVGRPAAMQQASPPAVDKPPPRIVLHSAVRIPSPAKKGPDADDWMTVDSTRRPRRPRRLMSPDLRGKCFNCLSRGHRAA